MGIVRYWESTWMEFEPRRAHQQEGRAWAVSGGLSVQSVRLRLCPHGRSVGIKGCGKQNGIVHQVCVLKLKPMGWSLEPGG